MDAKERSQHNEALAIQNIRKAYTQRGLHEAMALCVDYMGITAKEAFSAVKTLCADLQTREEMDGKI